MEECLLGLSDNNQALQEQLQVDLEIPLKAPGLNKNQLDAIF